MSEDKSTKECCETCRFWDGTDEKPSPDQNDEDDKVLVAIGFPPPLHNYGYCLRYPPIAQPKEGEVPVPVTDFSDWCGEWAAIPLPVVSTDAIREAVMVEREMCARVADGFCYPDNDIGRLDGRGDDAEDIAAAIRKRGEQ